MKQVEKQTTIYEGCLLQFQAKNFPKSLEVRQRNWCPVGENSFDVKKCVCVCVCVAKWNAFEWTMGDRCKDVQFHHVHQDQDEHDEM